MLEIREVPGIFVDAHLVDDRGVRFLSLWGRDTAIQEFLARLSLPERDGGLRTFRIGGSGDADACRASIADPDGLMRLTARRSGSVFGELVHLWLYDRLAVDADRSNGRALLLQHEGAQNITDALWQMLKQILWVPVLNHWQDVLLALLDDMGCLRRIEGYRVGAFEIDLSDRDRIESQISFLVRSGRLTLEEVNAGSCLEVA